MCGGGRGEDFSSCWGHVGSCTKTSKRIRNVLLYRRVCLSWRIGYLLACSLGRKKPSKFQCLDAKEREEHSTEICFGRKVNKTTNSVLILSHSHWARCNNLKTTIRKSSLRPLPIALSFYETYSGSRAKHPNPEKSATLECTPNILGGRARALIPYVTRIKGNLSQRRVRLSPFECRSKWTSLSSRIENGKPLSESAKENDERTGPVNKGRETL